MIVDLDTSTVTIAGRRFPACGLICPLVDGYDDSRADRLLGSRYGPGVLNDPAWHVMIPAENGVLVSVEQYDSTDVAAVALYARTCHLAHPPVADPPLWLPQDLTICNGRIVAATFHFVSRWQGAEPDWVVEFIDRVGRYPYREPPGPRAELVRYADSYAMRPDPTRL